MSHDANHTYKKIKDEIVFYFNSAMEDISHSYMEDNNSTYKHVYHYTTTPILLEILKNGIIHASNVQFMNDSQEVLYTKDMIEKVYIDNFSTAKYDFDFLERINTFYDIKNVFAISLCKRDDTLPLWYNYANGDGCNFALSCDMLLGITNVYNSNVLLSTSYNGGKLMDAKRKNH